MAELKLHLGWGWCGSAVRDLDITGHTGSPAQLAQAKAQPLLSPTLGIQPEHHMTSASLNPAKQGTSSLHSAHTHLGFWVFRSQAGSTQLHHLCQAGDGGHRGLGCLG